MVYLWLGLQWWCTLCAILSATSQLHVSRYEKCITIYFCMQNMLFPVCLPTLVHTPRGYIIYGKKRAGLFPVDRDWEDDEIECKTDSHFNGLCVISRGVLLVFFDEANPKRAPKLLPRWKFKICDSNLTPQILSKKPCKGPLLYALVQYNWWHAL